MLVFQRIVPFASLCVVMLHSVCAEEKLSATAKSFAPWEETGIQFKEVTAAPSPLRAARFHRLICDVRESEVCEGSSFHLILGVERTSGDGDLLMDPFTSNSIPSDVKIAIYDKQNRFIQWLPDVSEITRSKDNSQIISLEYGEMRGKLFEIHVGSESQLTGKSSVALSAGEYKLQLIASGRFFMGEYFKEKKDARLDDRSSRLAALEAARSKPAILKIVSGVAPVVKSEFSDAKLYAVLEIEDFVLQNKVVFPQAKLTVQNLSDNSYVGLIDPFLWMRSSEAGLPIQWTVRNVDSPNTETSQSGALAQLRRRARRSDFVILPPQGLASCRVGVLPQMPGRYEISVNLLGGLVVDQNKIQTLLTGDPSLGFWLGGSDSYTLRNDSITTCEFTVK